MARYSLRHITAYHEAGHAVTALVLGVPFGFVTIIRRGGVLGFVSLGDLQRHQTEIGWSDQDLGARLAIVLAAGVEAQRVAGLFSSRSSWSDDKRRCMAMASGCPERVWAICSLAAASYLQAHWEQVEAVAEALLDRRLLTYDETANVALSVRRDLQPRRTGRQRELPLALQAA